MRRNSVFQFLFIDLGNVTVVKNLANLRIFTITICKVKFNYLLKIRIRYIYRCMLGLLLLERGRVFENTFDYST